MKVFLDTNVLIAAFATRGLCADVVRVTLAAHEMVVSESVLAELGRNLVRKIGLPEREARSVVAFVRQEATVAPEAEPREPVRDLKDAAILAAALACAADVLVTGDRDLLEIERPVGIRIVSPRGFWQLAKGPADEWRSAPMGAPGAPADRSGRAGSRADRRRALLRGAWPRPRS